MQLRTARVLFSRHLTGRSPVRIAVTAAALAMPLAGCGGGDKGGVKPMSDTQFNDYRYQDGGAKPNADAKTNAQQEAGSSLSVNAYLWRASLETLGFMPLASADPYGGVIITDWYSPPTTSGERFKATAYVLGRQLRADGVRISIFRQVRDGGQWTDAPVSPATAADIENKVLARARELRSASAK